MLEKTMQILRINWKYNLRNNVLIACLICIVTPLLMGTKNLDAPLTAKVLEMYIALLGLLLLIPLFVLDQDSEISDVIKSKRTSMSIHYIIRLGTALLSFLVIVLLYMAFLQQRNCIFPFWSYFYGTIANGIFLGGLGIVTYAIIDQQAIAYMTPLLYYIICIGGGKKYLGKFYLFQMGYANIGVKHYLFLSGILMIVVGMIIRKKWY